MRALLFIVLGLVIGAVATITTVNALNARNAVPHGVMSLLGYHMGQARDAVTGKRCGSEVHSHFRAFEALAADIKPVFLTGEQPDMQFGRYADDLVNATSAATAIEATSCEAQAEALSKIGDACKACHRDYK